MLSGLAKRTRNADKKAEYERDLVLPPFPIELRYLWDTFWRLRRRKGGGFGVAPIEWPDLDAFRRLSGLKLSPDEIALIETIDDLYLTAMRRAGSESEGKDRGQPEGGR